MNIKITMALSVTQKQPSSIYVKKSEQEKDLEE